MTKQHKAVGHIVYEIMMFNGTNMKLQTGVSDQFEKNILLESFAIHCRNLFDFFYKKRKYVDDIVAYDYISQKKQFIHERTKTRILKNLTEKANKQVAHLTYKRNNYNRRTKGWSVGIIAINMNNTIVAFLKCLDSDKKKWFIELYRQYGVQI
jgi:hypothetical protein